MEKREARRRQGMLARAPAELLADLLDEVGHVPAFLSKALRLGMHLLNAEQALVFDNDSELVFHGMESANAVALRRERLRPLLRRRGIVCYSLPGFAAEAEDGAPVVGMAGGVRAGRTPFVFAFERDYAPFALDEKYLLEATLGQLARHRTDFNAGERIEPIYLRETCFVKAPPPRITPV